MADRFDKTALVDAFLKTHAEHYEIKSELGEGGAGYTFLAHDKRRGVDVCVKLLKTGTASEGSRRDWTMTTTIKHPLVGDTFTVEHFDIAGASAPCSAIVSRYIEGKSYSDFIDELRRLGGDHQMAAERDLAAFGVELCNAVAAIHAFKVGHGDLHERNIIVTGPTPDVVVQEYEPPRWRPVVIDFDSMTFTAPAEQEEAARIESDVRALRWQLGCLTVDTPWHSPIQKVLAEATSARDLAQASKFVRRVLRSFWASNPNEFQEAHWSDCVRGNLVETIAHRSYGPAAKTFLREVAEKLGVVDRLDAAIARFEKRVREEPGYPPIPVQTTVREVSVEKALDALIAKRT